MDIYIICLCEMDRGDAASLACYDSDQMTKFVFWSILLEEIREMLGCGSFLLTGECADWWKTN
jgi:hypothetical protein